MASIWELTLTAGQSIQSAYDSLPTAGGQIFLEPGRYNIGTGIVMDRNKPAAFVGVDRWRRNINAGDVPFGSSNMPGAVLFSSTNTTNWLFRMPTPASPANAHGFIWKHLTVEMGPSAGLIQGDNLVAAVIEDNAVYSTNGNAWLVQFAVRDAYSLGTSHGDDASWSRIMNNTIVGCGTMSAIGSGASTLHRHAPGVPLYQHNQNVTAFNFQTGGNAGISYYGGHRTPIIGNTFNNVGSPVIYLDMTSQSTCVGNGGTGTAAVFCELDRSSGNYLADVGLSNPGAGIMYRFDGGSRHNIAMAPGLSASADPNLPPSYGQSINKIVDTSGAKPNYYIRPGFHHLGTAE